ncbi:hypothetical protein BAE44_0017715 [Dichanthelium oligosanthes]|uniref:Uncharacterized protein n=1 Tax=Dichanthelium oligosanthes TaxID=888268 RepID=A0A1E5V7W4_9POAL|nr:hypothetical protein BAE44_0017715 [Dichanthelium oligosanthes]
MMKSALRQQGYRVKKKHFDPFPVHLVRKTTSIKLMTNMNSGLTLWSTGRVPKRW